MLWHLHSLKLAFCCNFSNNEHVGFNRIYEFWGGGKVPFFFYRLKRKRKRKRNRNDICWICFIVWREFWICIYSLFYALATPLGRYFSSTSHTVNLTKDRLLLHTDLTLAPFRIYSFSFWIPLFNVVYDVKYFPRSFYNSNQNHHDPI